MSVTGSDVHYVPMNGWLAVTHQAKDWRQHQCHATDKFWHNTIAISIAICSRSTSVMVHRLTYLDASVSQKLFHTVPGGVSLAHQLEYPLQNIPDGIWGCFQGADLIQVIGLDLAHGQAGSLNDGSHHS